MNGGGRKARLEEREESRTEGKKGGMRRKESRSDRGREAELKEGGKQGVYEVVSGCSGQVSRTGVPPSISCQYYKNATFVLTPSESNFAGQ